MGIQKFPPETLAKFSNKIRTQALAIPILPNANEQFTEFKWRLKKSTVETLLASEKYAFLYGQ